MKKLAFVLIATVILFSACQSKKTESDNTAVSKVNYTCPMHPEVKSDKPGACPKCGMVLEKK